MTFNSGLTDALTYRWKKLSLERCASVKNISVYQIKNSVMADSSVLAFLYLEPLCPLGLGLGPPKLPQTTF